MLSCVGISSSQSRSLAIKLEGRGCLELGRAGGVWICVWKRDEALSSLTGSFRLDSCGCKRNLKTSVRSVELETKETKKKKEVLMEPFTGLAHFPLFHYLCVEDKTLVVFSSVNSSSRRH